MAWPGDSYQLNQVSLPRGVCAERPWPLPLCAAAVGLLSLTHRPPSCFFVDLLLLVQSAWPLFQARLGRNDFGVEREEG